MTKQFRAYSPKWKKVVQSDDREYSIQITADGDISVWKDTICDDSAILLQYVDSKDREGREIYEGDELIGDEGDTYIVADLIKFHIWAFVNSIETNKTHTVVGNIYK